MAGGRHNAYTSYDYTAITSPSPATTGDRPADRGGPDDELRARPRRAQDGARGRPLGAAGPAERPRGTARGDHTRHHVPHAPLSQPDHRLEGRRAVPDARDRSGLLPTHYQPSNAVLVIVGDIHTESHAGCSSGSTSATLPECPATPARLSPRARAEGERRVVVKGAGSTAHLQAFFHTPAAGHPGSLCVGGPGRYPDAGQELATSQALVETDLVATVSSDYARRIDPGWFAFYLTARDGVSHQRIEDAFTQALERIRQEGVTDRELQKAINQVRADLTIELRQRERSGEGHRQASR